MSMQQPVGYTSWRSKQLHRRLSWLVALVVKSQEGQVLPSTATTTPMLRGVGNSHVGFG